ncbi:hypothetical protein GF377_06025 [candidate division GN15 bacterium]|nr:hypothetical protein [candidate division GN15 bacterium]
MTQHAISDIAWYRDPVAVDSGLPGICHSFVASLATALNHIHGELDPVWLMGTCTFAFRIVVNETFCPSAMSVFDWNAVLPAAVENTGHRCTYITRLWDEENLEVERKQEAHEAILAALRDDRPSVVWDVADTEWGLIVGYDDSAGEYVALSHAGDKVELPVDKLGRNGINVLSVAIPGQPNGRSRKAAVRTALEIAVRHAEGKEWMERPRYQDGLAAFDLWSILYERGALLAEAGKAEKVGPDIPRFMAYYAAHYFSARWYAGRFLLAVADGDRNLENAAKHCDEAASYLKLVWEESLRMNSLDDPDLLKRHGQHIADAGRAERAAIEAIKNWLAG